MDQGKRRAHIEKQLAGRLPGQGRAFTQIGTVEKLHRVVGPDLVDAVVVHLDHSRVRKLREGVELLLEQPRRLLGELAVAGGDEPFQRDVSSEDRVTHPINHRCPATSQDLLDVVATSDDGGMLSLRLGL